jgi:hypothetical protein
MNNSPRRTAIASKFPSHMSGVEGEDDDGILCLSSCPLWSSTVSSSPVNVIESSVVGAVGDSG